MANDKVLKLGNRSAAQKTNRSNGYLMLTSIQRCEIGEQAAAHGVTASLKYYAMKYPNLPL